MVTLLPSGGTAFRQPAEALCKMRSTRIALRHVWFGGVACDHWFSSAPLESFGSMKHVLSAIVMNQPGVLAHISGMLASRAFNIESLAVGETERSEFSRITFVVAGDDKVLDQVRKQLEKIITVVKVVDYLHQDLVERDLMLIKVSTAGGQLSEVRELVEIFRGKVVNVGAHHVMVEISGSENKLTAFINLMRKFGIIEMVRTGRIALSREKSLSVEDALLPPPIYEEAD